MSDYRDIDPTLTNVENADILGVSETTIRRWKRVAEQNEQGYLYAASIRDESTGSWHKYKYPAPEPRWPVVQPATAVTVNVPFTPPKPNRGDYKLALKCADTQIGFRALPDGTFESFHDESAMAVFANVVLREQPDSIDILGDFLDLPSQSRWAQEAAFARTTQLALDAAHAWLAVLRASAPKARIRIVEGNHDRRLQTYVENNALAAFGLRQAGIPGGWPVLSLPNLLRLDELDIEYVDAYPAAATWDNDTVRNIHGTKANSRGSTTAQYAHDMPHISQWVGHTHRCEITYKTVMGPRGEAIETYVANPGALCKTDGTVPSVHGSTHADGTSARVVEDWQTGWGANLYNDTESWPFVFRIRDGKTLYSLS